MNMKALVYMGKQNLVVKDVPIPEIAENDVLIKLKYCGVCGTDMHIYNGEGGSYEVTPPLIMGHEFSGIVEKVGSKVSKVKAGDLVTVDPNDMCGNCYYCNNAMEQFCTNNIGIGTTVDGGFAEYCTVCDTQVFKYKEGIDAATAAMTEPVSCCIHGIMLCDIKPGDEVLVIGGGPIGLIMLQLAKLAGAGKLILSEPIAEKRALAKKMGADLTINPLEEDAAAILKANCKNLNTVIECVGSVHTIQNAIDWAGKGATIMMFGLTGPAAELKISPDVFFKKEIKLTSSFINPYTFERAISFLESGKLNVKDLITDIVDLEDSIQVFEDKKYRKSGKVLIKLSD